MLANRLSADPGISVLLIEAGGPDINPLIAIPRRVGQLFGDPATVWHYSVRPFGPAQQVETRIRGTTLGDSSAVNGMVNNRGNRADYDALEALGNPGWGWDQGPSTIDRIGPHRCGGAMTARTPIEPCHWSP